MADKKGLSQQPGAAFLAGHLGENTEVLWQYGRCVGQGVDAQWAHGGLAEWIPRVHIMATHVDLLNQCGSRGSESSQVPRGLALECIVEG